MAVKPRTWILLLAAFALGVAAFQLPKGSALSYQGKSMEKWLELYDEDGAGGLVWRRVKDSDVNENVAAANFAVQQMGTNALSLLLAEVQAEDWPWRTTVDGLIRQFTPLRGGWPTKRAKLRRHRAALALRALGPAAAPALPLLSRMLLRRDTSEDSAYALLGLGPAALPVFMSALTNQRHGVADNWIQTCGLWGLAQNGGAAAEAVPRILPLLQKVRVRNITIWALGEIGARPDLVVPALQSIAQTEPDPVVAEFARDALAKFEAKERAGSSNRPPGAPENPRLTPNSSTLRSN